MLILYAIFWFTVASSHPFSSSISWYDAEIDMSNIDVVITLANGSTPYYGIVVNTEADVHISNMAITLPNSTVINTGPMISYISTYHQDIYDIIMPAAGFTEDFIKSLGNNDGQIIKVKLQSNNTITQSLGPLLAPTDDDDDYESDPERDFASDSDEIIESNMNSTPIPIYYHPSYKS